MKAIIRASGDDQIKTVLDVACGIGSQALGVGIGTKLIGALIDLAKNTGLIRKINLRVHQDNVRATRL